MNQNQKIETITTDLSMWYINNNLLHISKVKRCDGVDKIVAYLIFKPFIYITFFLTKGLKSYLILRMALVLSIFFLVFTTKRYPFNQ